MTDALARDWRSALCGVTKVQNCPRLYIGSLGFMTVFSGTLAIASGIGYEIPPTPSATEVRI
jgi:hypothetical protein